MISLTGLLCFRYLDGEEKCRLHFPMHGNALDTKIGGDFPPLCQSPLHANFWGSSSAMHLQLSSCSLAGASCLEKSCSHPCSKRRRHCWGSALLYWWVEHSPFEELPHEKVLSCDGQVTLKEQRAGNSQIMNCQCHHREFSQGHSPATGREGTSINLSGLFLMKGGLCSWHGILEPQQRHPGSTRRVSANQCSSD